MIGEAGKIRLKEVGEMRRGRRDRERLRELRRKEKRREDKRRPSRDWEREEGGKGRDRVR